MYQFFKFDKHELHDLMQKTLDYDVNSVHFIDTGWTNIVVEAQTSKADYIFRFPRNSFWANAIIKDCLFCELIYGSMPFSTPDIKLIIDKNRPFSVHKKIPGRALSDAEFNSLTKKSKETIANECALFLKKLHEVPIESFPVGSRKTLNDFLIDLAQVHKGVYDYSKHFAFREIEKQSEKLCLVHGDFNQGNILIDDNNHVTAVIDFAFASRSVPETDIGRFLSRADDEFGEFVINAYDDLSHEGAKCQRQRVKEIAKLFQYVDMKYMDYLKSNEKTVIIPAL